MGSIDQFGITGIPEVDTLTLQYLDDLELGKVCSLNRYTRDLCLDPHLWQQRIKLYYRITTLPDGLTWEEYYRWLRFNPPNQDIIGRVIGLSPDEAFVRKITEYSVTFGSEKYASLSLLLPRAFETGDRSLVDYFMDRFMSLMETAVNTDDLIVYPTVVASAFAEKWDDYGLELLDIYLRQQQLILGPISRALGKDRNIDVYEEFILPRATIQDEGMFIRGLIEGRYYEDAKDLLLEVEDPEVWALLIRPIIRSQDNDLIRLMMISPKPAFYNNSIRLNLIIEGRFDLVSDLDHVDPNTIFEGLLSYDVPLALEYFDANKSRIDLAFIQYPDDCSLDLIGFYREQGIDWIYYVDLNKCSLNDIGDLILEIDDPDRLGVLYAKSVRQGAYDFITFIDPLTDSRDDALFEAFKSGHKDIVYHILAIDSRYTNEYLETLEIGPEMSLVRDAIVTLNTIHPDEINNYLFSR